MKRVYKILAVALLISLLLGVFFYPITVKKKTVVPFTIYRTGEQLNNAGSLAKWLTPFSDNNTTSVTNSGKQQLLESGDCSTKIEEATPFGAVIRSKKGTKSAYFSFTASPDSGRVQSSQITLTYKSTLFRQWFSKSRLEQNAEKGLENLKEYMTDTKRFYGFEIQFTTVADTSFLFSRITVPVAEKRAGLIKVFDKLIAYAQKNNSGYNGVRIMYTLTSGNEITIFAGIGVTVETQPAGDIEYKRMPLGKNLLETNYQGPFGQSSKAFEALEVFKADQQLSSMAIPYQKILSDGYDFADDQMVQLKVYYPIF